MKNKKMAMLFERGSTITRVSIEIGMNLLGGYAIFFNKENIGPCKREPVKDITFLLSKYVDIILY